MGRPSLGKTDDMKKYMKEYMAQIIACDVCNTTLKICNRSHHNKTKKHINNVTNQKNMEVINLLKNKYKDDKDLSQLLATQKK